MDWIFSPEAWIALATLTAVEIVLGIDNIIFLTITVEKLPIHQQGKARFTGLALAMIFRILLLFSLSWLMRLTVPIFTIFQNAISGRDLILILGGLFLLAKSTYEIHDKIEGHEGAAGGTGTRNVTTFAGAMIQIILLDLVFSLDSVITAIGMAKHLPVMVLAVIIAVVIMMVSAAAIADYIQKHPTIKMLALSFLLLIGMALIGEGLDLHIPKGYIYFAMAYSLFVEMLNTRIRKPAVQ